MKKLIALALMVMFIGGVFQNASANVVIVDSYVILNAVSEGATVSGQNYFDAKRDIPENPNFTGSLGTFNIEGFSVTIGGTTYAPNSVLQLKGAEIKTESTGGDYQNANNFARMFYTVTQSSVNPTSFTQFDLGYRGEQPYPINKWDTTGATINLLDGLTAGTYRLTVYFESNGSWWNGSSQQFFGIAPDNNCGTNYSATFNVVPEPSSASLMALGAAGLLALRRRRNA